MENASKALTMAGGMLIGVLVLSMLIFGLLKIGGFFSDESKANDEKIVSDFNKQWLQFEKNQAYVMEQATDKNNASASPDIAKVRKYTLTLMDVVSIANMVMDNNSNLMYEQDVTPIKLKIEPSNYHTLLNPATSLSSPNLTDFTDGKKCIINTNIFDEIDYCGVTTPETMLENKDSSLEQCKIWDRFYLDLGYGANGMVNEITITYCDDAITLDSSGNKNHK